MDRYNKYMPYAERSIQYIAYYGDIPQIISKYTGPWGMTVSPQVEAVKEALLLGETEARSGDGQQVITKRAEK